ncbi:MAG: carboxypeptidase regulatory-like domain-containing protein, partial [Thermoanaerobaculia bacterium]
MFGRLLALASFLAFASPGFAALTGTVMNAEGEPVAGARISAYALETAAMKRVRLLSDKPERAPLATLQTPENGRFSLDWPKEHAVAMIQIEANGFAPHSIRVERDDEVGALSLTLAPSKSGRITAAGKPVGGARLVVADQSEIISTTDAEGRYTVPDPSKWSSRIIVIHPDFAIFDEPSRRGASATVSLDRTLQRGVNLEGRVLGRDGTTAVAGARIFIDGWPSATSGENGAFTVAHAPEKWEWISATANSLTGRRARGKDVTIRLQAAMTVTGLVRDAKTDFPVAGAEVSLNPAGRFNFSGARDTAISDAKGNFTLTDVAPGSYAMFAMRPGYRFEPADVSVAAGAKALRTVLGQKLARVAGTVLDEQKRPVRGARITPQNVGSSAMPRMTFTRSFTTSAPDGTFVVFVEPDSDQQLEAQKKGLPSTRGPTLRLSSGERKRGVVIIIPSGIAVTGRVTNRDGQPLAGVTVAASDARNDAGFGRSMIFAARRERDDDLVQTAPDGTFSLQVKEGTYDFAFRREGFATKIVRSQEVSASAGAKPIPVTLDPGVEITGRVTRSGVGVAGADVNVFGEGSMESTETAPDGTFRLINLTPGPLMLAVNKRDEFISHDRRVTAPAQDVDIEVPAGGRVTGRVLDKDTRAPVTTFEAGVSGTRSAGGMMLAAPNQMRPFTSDDGVFVLDNVPAGSMTLVVQAGGYTAARVPTINVEEGKTTPEIEVLMDRGVRVTGRVTGPDGGALSGVTVRHGRTASRQMRIPGLSAAITDSNGDYTLEAVESGETSFTFMRSGYVTAEKTADLKGKDARVDAQLTTGTRVSGTVVSDSGVPVADASVQARSAAGGSSFAGTRTDQNGSFQMEAMAPGRYTFSAQKQGYPRTEINDFDIATGAPVRLVLKAGGTIYGRVIGLTAEEMPTASVIASNPNGRAAAPVDGSGNYRIEGAPVGTVRLMARTGGGFATGSKSSPARSVQVEAGSSVQQDIEFKTDTVIRGRVTRTGQPVSNAMVSFSPRAGQAQTNARVQSDASGVYEVTGLDDATYNVGVIDIQRSFSYNTTYEVRGSGNFDIDIRATTLRGRVVDATSGEPVSEAILELRDPDSGSPRFGMRVTQSDASGAFVMDAVPVGSWNLNAEKQGYGTRVVEVKLSESPSDIEVKLAPNAGITVRVLDARDGRLLSSFMRVFDSQNRVVYESPMRFGGFGSPEELRIGLDPGTYRAVVSASGYASRNATITSPGSHTIGLTPGGSILVRSKGSEIRRARLM